jgi:hypothetical protein
MIVHTVQPLNISNVIVKFLITLLFTVICRAQLTYYYLYFYTDFLLQLINYYVKLVNVSLKYILFKHLKSKKKCLN